MSIYIPIGYTTDWLPEVISKSRWNEIVDDGIYGWVNVVHDSRKRDKVIISFYPQTFNVLRRSIDQPQRYNFEWQQANEEQRGNNDEHDDDLTTRSQRRLRSGIVGYLRVLRLHDEAVTDQPVDDHQDE